MGKVKKIIKKTKWFVMSFLILTFLLSGWDKEVQAMNTTTSLNDQTNLLESFFTDDSRFYFKLYKNGFDQRFRLSPLACEYLVSAQIVFRSSLGKTTPLQTKNMNSQELTKWPSIYGLNNDNVCWFELKARGLDLNQPKNNEYVIALKFKSNPTIYFEGLKNFLLPSRRFTFGPQISTWNQLGPQGVTPVQGGGYFFKVWEPRVKEVHLFLESESARKMIPDSALKEKRSHVLYIPEAKTQSQFHYQFLLSNNQYENLIVGNNDYRSKHKIDPMGFEISYDKKGGSHNGYVGLRSLTSQEKSFSWSYDDLILKKQTYDRSWMIYQLWPLTFNPPMVDGKYKQGTFNSIIEKIGYIKGLGVNAVELLPVNESRFYAGWGYALDSLLLIDKTYGSRNDLKNLVDQFHKNQLKVIFDVVLNHINNSLAREPLSPTNTTTKFYDGDTGWGPKPNFKSIMVRKQIVDSLLNLQREFHVDGFRFDMVEYVYHDNAFGYQLLWELMQILKSENPYFYNSAEQLPDNVMVTFPSDQGLGFDSQWNDKFKNFFELEFDHYRAHQRKINTRPLVASLKGYAGFPQQEEYKFGHPLRTVNYLGSHDFVGNKNPLIRIITGYESYEQSGHNVFTRVRPLEDPEFPYLKFKAIHNSFSHGVGRLAYGTLFTKPGSILFFQGEELASDINIENEWSYLNAQKGNTIPSEDVDIHRYIASHRMPWEYLDPKQDGPLYFLKPEERALFSGYTQFFKDMLRFKSENHSIDWDEAYNVKTFYNKKVVTYTVGKGDQEHFVILNFDKVKESPWIYFPGDNQTWWKEVINSSELKYGGNSNFRTNIVSYLGARENNIRMGENSILIFKKSSEPEIQEPLYLVSNLTGWQFKEEFKLVQNSAHKNLYVTEITVPHKVIFEFKLSTLNWEVDLGSGQQTPILGMNSTIFSMPNGGYLSYPPTVHNAQAELDCGTYRFVFNMETFGFSFSQLNASPRNCNP